MNRPNFSDHLQAAFSKERPERFVNSLTKQWVQGQRNMVGQFQNGQTIEP